jgi:hypothetical protein
MQTLVVDSPNDIILGEDILSIGYFDGVWILFAAILADLRPPGVATVPKSPF